MAENSTPVPKRNRNRRRPLILPAVDRKRQQPQLGLHIPPDAEPLLTPFRAQALQTIYEIAYQELGDRIRSAVVLAEADQEAPDQMSLVLAIWTDVDGTEWSRAFRAISDAVFDVETSWSEIDRDDYINTIQFELLPLNK